MKIGILNNEEAFRREIMYLIIDRFPTFNISLFSDIDELLNNGSHMDLLILDIELPKMDGITFSKKYRIKYPNIIFVTDHSEFVFDAFGKNVIGFIKKSDMNEKLINKLIDFMLTMNKRIVLATERGKRIFTIDDILYFYYDKNKTVYLKTKADVIQLKTRSLKSLYKMQDLSMLYFLNRNILVNIGQISHYLKASKKVVLTNNEKIQVSRRNWKIVYDHYNDS